MGFRVERLEVRSQQETRGLTKTCLGRAASSCAATCHCPHFSQALMAALAQMPFTLTFWV